MSSCQGPVSNVAAETSDCPFRKRRRPGHRSSQGASRIPVAAGFSLSNYYEGATGSDDSFGFAQAGVALSTPLNFVPARVGSWTLSGGVSILFLGNNLQAINGGDSSEAILSLGLGIAF